jgi:hypothetical protein
LISEAPPPPSTKATCFTKSQGTPTTAPSAFQEKLGDAFVDTPVSSSVTSPAIFSVSDKKRRESAGSIYAPQYEPGVDDAFEQTQQDEPNWEKLFGEKLNY